MAQTTTQVAPTYTFYDDFPRDWESLPGQARQDLGDFLVRLQKNPLDPKLLDECEQARHFYAFIFSEGYAVYWKLEMANPASVTAMPEKIIVLAIKAVQR